MIIGWVADHFYPHVKRGAELHTRILIEEGERRGYDIVKCEGNIVKDVDLYIVGTCVDNFNAGELLAYLSQKRYINMEHDLRAPKEFKDLKLKRKPEDQVLYVGDYSWEKGYEGLVDYLQEHPESIIWHYGAGFPKKHPRMKEMGQTAYEEMPKVYNQFQSMIFLPNYPQACCRIMGEAFLCKIPNIITNQNSGFMSYNFTLDDYKSVREKLINGQKYFWDRIEDEF